MPIIKVETPSGIQQVEIQGDVPTKEEQDKIRRTFWKDEIKKPVEAQSQEEMPWYESAAKGAIQGATLGFADELAPIGSYIGGILYDWTADEGMGTGTEFDYTRDRDRAREMYREAEEANPGAFLTGQVAGGVGAVLPGAAAASTGVLPAMAYGARLGALAGAGSSEAELSTDPLGVATDMATGAVVGGALPAAAGVAGLAGKKVLSPVVDKMQEIAERYVPGVSPQKGKEFLEGIGKISGNMREKRAQLNQYIKEHNLSKEEAAVARSMLGLSKQDGVESAYQKQLQELMESTGVTPEAKKIAMDISRGKDVVGLEDVAKTAGRGVVEELKEVAGVPTKLFRAIKEGKIPDLDKETALQAGRGIWATAEPFSYSAFSGSKAMGYGKEAGSAWLTPKIRSVMEGKLANPIRESLRGATPAVVDNVLSQTDPEYREAKRKEQEEDNE